MMVRIAEHSAGVWAADRLPVQTETGASADFSRAFSRALRYISEGATIDDAVDFLILRGHSIFGGARPRISITEEGTLSFRYDGHLPRDVASCRTVFWQTNEAYSTMFLRKLSELEGINRYVGILGGADQHAQLLAALQKRNQISNMVLIDDHDRQILAGMLALSAYNRFREGEWKNNRHWPGFTKSRIDVKAVNVEFLNMDVREALKRVEANAYFIYLSNVFTFPLSRNPYIETAGTLSLKESMAVLLKIQNNRDILNGSVVMLTSPSSGDHLLLRKEDGKLRFMACDPKLTGVGRSEYDYWKDESRAFATSEKAVNEFLDVLGSRSEFHGLLRS